MAVTLTLNTGTNEAFISWETSELARLVPKLEDLEGANNAEKGLVYLEAYLNEQIMEMEKDEIRETHQSTIESEQDAVAPLQRV